MEFQVAQWWNCEQSRGLSARFDLVLAELRLVFGQLEDSAHLHEPYIELNASLVAALELGDTAAAISQPENILRRRGQCWLHSSAHDVE